MNLKAKTLDQIVGVIVASTTLTWDEVMAKVRDVQEELHGFVTLDGAASLLAYRMNIFKDEVRDLGKIGEEAGPSPPETDSRSTDLEKTKTGGSGMGISDIYAPVYLNVEYVTAHQLWDKPLSIVRSEVRDSLKEGETQRKVALHLEGVAVPLLLNRTNAKALSKVWGDDYNAWPGKQIRLTKRLVQYKNEEVDAIRVSAV
jgi:hypothetical protein